MIKNIYLNGVNYPIDDSVLEDATNSLKTYFSTGINGSGATVKFGGVTYNLSSDKINTAKGSFISYLATVAGTGAKVIINGTTYNVASDKFNAARNTLAVYLNDLGAEVEAEELEGTGQEFYTTAPSTMSFRSTAPLDEFQEVQVNGETVDPSNYTLEEGSTIVKLSHKYLSTLGVGKHEVAIVSDSKTVKGDFIIKAPELNEYGFYYNQPYYGGCNRSEGLTHFGGTFIIMFEENGTVNLYQIDSSNAYQTTYTFTDGKIAFEFYNDQSDSSPFTGSFSADGKTLSGSVDVTPFWGSPVTFDDIVLEVRPEEAAADNLYVYYKQHTQYAEEGTWEYFPRVRTLTEYPSAMSSILDIPVTAIAYEGFLGFSSMTRLVIPSTVKAIGYAALNSCENLSIIEFLGTVEQWNSISMDEKLLQDTSVKFIQCSNGQVAI